MRRSVVKKSLAVVLAAVMAVSSLFTVNVQAEDLKYGSLGGDTVYLFNPDNGYLMVGCDEGKDGRMKDDEWVRVYDYWYGGIPVKDIKDIHVVQNVTYIGKNVFSNCGEANLLEIGSKVEEIGESAFVSCKLKTVTPSGVPVQEGVFNIPGTVKKIGKNAFMFNYRHKKIIINEGTKELGGQAFLGNSGVTEVVLPQSLEEIGDSCFVNCSSLKTLTIPKTVKKIGECIASGSTMLTSLEVEAGNTNYEVVDGCLIEKSTGTLIQYTTGSKNETFVVPEGVKVIGSAAFYGANSLKSIKLPETVTTIESMAFAYCPNVTSIELPKSLKTIGSGAFYQMTKLTEVKYNGSKEDWEKIDNKDTNLKLFDDNSDSHTIHSFTLIKDTATCGVAGKMTYRCACGNEKVEDSLATGKHTFDAGKVTKAATTTAEGVKTYTCTVCGFTKNEAITKLESSAGGQTGDKTSTPGVGSISSDGKTLTDEDGTKYLVSDKLTNKKLKKSVSVADKKTAGKYKITKITKKGGKVTGGTVTYMKPYNKNCKTANIKASIKIAGATFKVTTINNNAFKNCKKLTKVTIGSNISKIGKSAFYGCSKLKTVTIKTKKLKASKVGSKAFGKINAKAKVKVPSSKVKSYKTILKKKGLSGKNQKVTK